jgi:hypothetical protein
VRALALVEKTANEHAGGTTFAGYGSMPARRVVPIIALLAVVPTLPARADDPPEPSEPPETATPTEPGEPTEPAEPAERSEPPGPAVAIGTTLGDRPPEPEPPLEPGEEPAAPDWDAAPPGDEASGIARESESSASKLRWIPRAALFLPRWAFWTAMQPVRGLAYAYNRYHIADRFEGSFFNPDRTIGLYPTASYGSNFGVTVGARFVHRDMFGEGERLKLRADYGGRFRQAYGFEIGSGRRLGNHLKLELDTRYEKRPKERFVGYGNADEIDPVDGILFDPTSGVAVATRYREDLFRSILTAETPIVGALKVRLSGAIVLRDFGPPEENSGPDIREVYDTSRLPGFDDGVENFYVEGELAYDTRRRTSIYETEVLDATGWLAYAYLGAMTGIEGDPSDFFRYGAEVQRFIDLYNGNRILTLRVLVEAVGGTDVRDDNEIAFSDLPELGGSEYLRGYDTSRFRDKAITLGTAEYSWSLGNYWAGYLFVDAGRPFPSLADFTFEDFRVGYGAGVQIHGRRSFIMRAQIAGSEEGVQLDLVVSPNFGRRERAGRR